MDTRGQVADERCGFPQLLGALASDGSQENLRQFGRCWRDIAVHVSDHGEVHGVQVTQGARESQVQKHKTPGVAWGLACHAIVGVTCG